MLITDWDLCHLLSDLLRNQKEMKKIDGEKSGTKRKGVKDGKGNEVVGLTESISDHDIDRDSHQLENLVLISRQIVNPQRRTLYFPESTVSSDERSLIIENTNRVEDGMEWTVEWEVKAVISSAWMGLVVPSATQALFRDVAIGESTSPSNDRLSHQEKYFRSPRRL